MKACSDKRDILHVVCLAWLADLFRGCYYPDTRSTSLGSSPSRWAWAVLQSCDIVLGASAQGGWGGGSECYGWRGRISPPHVDLRVRVGEGVGVSL